MFSDPLSVTYDGSSLTLPRVEANGERTAYRTADKEFQIRIWSSPNKPAGKSSMRMAEIEFSRRLPDPTPSNHFDDYRRIVNAFGMRYTYDITRTELGDLDLLRVALLNLVNPAFQSRLVSGEK